MNFSSPTLTDGKSSGWRVGKISVDQDLVLLIWALEGQFMKSNKLQEIRSILNEENFKWGVYEDTQCSTALKAEPKMLHWKDKARGGKWRNANTGQHDIAEYKWYMNTEADFSFTATHNQIFFLKQTKNRQTCWDKHLCAHKGLNDSEHQRTSKGILDRFNTEKQHFLQKYV